MGSADIRPCNFLDTDEIQILNDDCLIHIFSFLSIIDRFRIRRVCERWRLLSQLAWQTLKGINMSEKFWGIKKNSKLIVKRDILEIVLQLCGKFVTHIDLSYDDDYLSKSDRKIRIQSSKPVVSLIHQYCPNIRSINLGRPCAASTIEFISSNFTNLTHFALDNHSNVDEGLLSPLFLNNRNIRYFKMKKCYHFKTDFLLDLNPDVVRELHLIGSLSGPIEHFSRVFEKLHKLDTLYIDLSNFGDLSWNSVLNAIDTHLINLKSLTFHLFGFFSDDDGDIFQVSNLKKLKKLEIDTMSYAIETFFIGVTHFCEELTELRITSTTLTNTAISTIANLPRLRKLYLNSMNDITDREISKMLQLKSLECYRCPELQIDGFLQLIKTSECIESIKLNCCANVNVSQLIDHAIHCKRDKLQVTIESSELEFELVKNVHTLTKIASSAVLRVNRVCYECFKAQCENASCDKCCDTVQVYENLHC